MAADLAVFGAKIRTMDPDMPLAEAIAVKDGRIVAVGSNDEVRDSCDSATERLDGSKWSITPGLTDGHQHLFTGAELGRGIDFDRTGSLAALRERLHAERKRIGPGKWILGFALEYSTFEGQQYHYDLIADAAGEGPMMVYSLDLHTAFVNEHALRAAGVDGPRRFADASSVVCDENGRPTGELREKSAMQLVGDVVEGSSREDRIGWYRDAMYRQNAVGITSIHLMDGNLDTVALLDELETRSFLDLRVWLHYRMAPATTNEEVDEILRGGVRKGGLWEASGVKFLLDGVVETGTAWLEEPDTHGDGGSPMWPDLGRYQELVRRFATSGYRIATHAIGDRAVRFVLDTYADLPKGTAQHRIEHIETSPDRTISRFRPEGVTASMQPIHMRWMKPDLSDPWSERLGPARCEHTMRSGDINAAGARVVLGSDWPVAPFDPRLGFFAAQLRRAPDLPDEGSIGTSRPLSGEETLAGYTRNAAEVVGRAGELGILRPGYHADFVAWTEDPSTCNPSDVLEDQVLATVIGGRVVYTAP